MNLKREFRPLTATHTPTRAQRIECGDECPDCGSRNTESNGHTEYRCVECDHRWGVHFGMPYGYDYDA
jgi:transposase-like protein